jgi:CubicO group peptidase (beta-lactamase class C family)
VTVPGSKPVYVSIGLAGDGMIARTILYSLRTASRTTAKPTGVVTGVAYACEGAVLLPGTILRVTVSLQGSGAGVSETVRSGAKYRFSVPPGVYQVIGWWGSRRVIVRAGYVVTANFMNTCI